MELGHEKAIRGNSIVVIVLSGIVLALNAFALVNNGGMTGEPFAVILALAGSVITLVIGGVILRFCGDASKLKSQFVLSIVGAVIGFLTTSILAGVMLVFTAVFAYKDLKTMKGPGAGVS